MHRWLVIVMLAWILEPERLAAQEQPEVLIIDQKVSVRAEDVTLARLLELWDQATGMRSTVPPELANQKISIRFIESNMNEALRKIFDGQPFGYFFVDGQVVVTAPAQSTSVAEPALIDNNITLTVEQPVLAEIAKPQPQPLPQQAMVIPTPFGPILSPPASRQQPFTQLPPVLGAPPAPPFFAPPLRTIPPAGAANGPLENQLFGPLPIYQSPNLPPLNPPQNTAMK